MEFITTLADHHLEMLKSSAISDDVIVARGYFTATRKADLQRLEFPRSQQIVPSLIIPVYNTRGDLATHILRPDHPRRVQGKVRKYEFMAGSHMVLDVPNLPAMRAQLSDPQIPLWITEGSKKTDALASIGCCTLAVGGVWNWRGTNAKGGKTALGDWEDVALNDRIVRLCYDSDLMTKPEVYGALVRLAEFLAARGACVSYVYLPPDAGGGKVGIDDYLSSGHDMADLLGLTTTERRRPPGDPGDDGRPAIRISPDITRVVDQAMAAIERLPDGPHVFQRARQLVRIVQGAPPPPWLARSPDAPILRAIDSAVLRELAGQAARWHKYDKRADAWEDCLPPAWAIETMLARGAWAVPVLESVITAPTIRGDGSPLTTPGYDPQTGLYLSLNGIGYPPIPQHPTLDDARSAIGALQEVFLDFPWLAPYCFSASLAAVLTLAARGAINGSTPLFGVSATVRGAGKGLLIDSICVAATGREAPRWPQVSDHDEERKRLLSLVLDGDPCLHIDNCTQVLGSPALNMALTSRRYKDRILGKTESPEAPMNAVFFASGNNLRYATDTGRRVVPIHLDPRMENPEIRSGFAHSPLLTWVRREHPRLLVAALTILRGFYEAGCPDQQLTPMGSFEEWSDLIRQALVWAGECDPNEGRTDIEGTSDPAFERLAQLLAAWYACYQHDPKTLQQAVQDIALYTMDANAPRDKWDGLLEALANLDRRYDGRRINTQRTGEVFAQSQGRVIDHMRLIKVGTRNRAAQWAIETIAGAVSDNKEN